MRDAPDRPGYVEMSPEDQLASYEVARRLHNQLRKSNTEVLIGFLACIICAVGIAKGLQADVGDDVDSDRSRQLIMNMVHAATVAANDGVTVTPLGGKH